MPNLTFKEVNKLRLKAERGEASFHERNIVKIHDRNVKKRQKKELDEMMKGSRDKNAMKLTNGRYVVMGIPVGLGKTKNQ